MILFYKVRTHPSKFSPIATRHTYSAESVSTMQAQQDADVVSIKPWEHNNVMIGSVNARGRKSWGAKEPVWKNEVVYYNTKQKSLTEFLTNIVIHHTNNSNSISSVEQKQVSKGYAALGYHFFISKSGEVFEGRPLEVMGSNAGAGILPGAYFDPDFGAVGITMQGDYHHSDDWFTSDKAPKVQLASLERLVVAVKNKFCINQLLMHREIIRSGKPTVCPGDHMVGHVVSLRKKLGMRGA